MSTKKIWTNRSRTKEFKLIAGVMAVSGLITAALAFLTPQVVATNEVGAEMAVITAYTALNMLMALLGGFMFAAGNAYILLKEDNDVQDEYRARPLPPMSVPPPETAAEEQRTTVQAAGRSEELSAEPPTVQEPVMEEAAENQDGHLVLRLLSGDERTVFQAIMDAGGEIYQKEIVNSTDMSDAKVSRVLDRLAEKGVITKERQGMSNRVRIVLEK